MSDAQTLTFQMSPNQTLAFEDLLRQIRFMAYRPGGPPVNPHHLLHELSCIARGDFDRSKSPDEHPRVCYFPREGEYGEVRYEPVTPCPFE